MALRYSAEDLLHLRESPLCNKPTTLPPAEEWMGAPPDQLRAQKQATNDRPRTNDPLLDSNNRRPGVDRHVSRNSANPDDLVFGPPRMAFSSARGNKTFDNNEKLSKDGGDGGGGWFDLRSRGGDQDGDRYRDNKGGMGRRRGESDQDNEGWSTVKPRKSFGHEGAERFHGKMGGNFKEEKRTGRDRPDRDANRERAPRQLEGGARDKEPADAEGRMRHVAPGRSKMDSWHRSEGSGDAGQERREPRGDRMKSWRDRDRTDVAEDRGSGRNQDRRWGRDRDQRQERDPEWMDEPFEAPREAHTQQDFQKWMESMKKAKNDADASASTPTGDKPSSHKAAQSIIEAAKPPVQSAPAVETGPDKFFMAFGSGTGLDATTPGEQKEPAAKPKATGGKSSRFTSFFAPQEEPRGKTEPPTPLAALFNGAGAAAAAASVSGGPPAQEEEKQAFAQLLAKLQKQSVSATPPGPSPFAAPSHASQHSIGGDGAKKSALTSPEPWQQYGGEGAGHRPPSQQPHHEILAPRPQPQSARPEQLLQDLVGHHQRTTSQGTGHPEMTSARNTSNTEFLMNLMRAGPDTSQQPDAHMMRMHNQPQFPGNPQVQQHSRKQGTIPPPQERDADFAREARGGGGGVGQRAMRPGPPPGFPMDEPPYQGGGGGDRESRPNQPTQILQRPQPPPGLDQMPPNWMTGAGGNQGGQMPPPPPQARGPGPGPMMPPPGLAGGPPGHNRNMPMPQMFPPNFPPSGGMPPPPPEGLGGMPPRNGPPPPPPGFFNGPPPGFMPPGMVGFNGPPGMDPHAFGGSPFEGRGMPPPSHNGRGANFNRQ